MNNFLNSLGITNYTLLTVGIILFIIGLVFLFYIKGGFRELKKMWLDMLINPATGSYSLKRFTMFGSVILGWLICFAQAFELKIYPYQVFNSKEVPMWVPILLFIVGLGASAALLLGHLNARRTADKNGNPLEPAYTEPVYTEEVQEQGGTTDTPTDADDFTPPSFAPKIKERIRIPTAKQL